MSASAASRAPPAPLPRARGPTEKSSGGMPDVPVQGEKVRNPSAEPTGSAAAARRTYVKVFEVDAGRAGPGREVEEPEREAERLVGGVDGDVTEDGGLVEEHLGELRGGQVALVGRTFEIGQLVDHRDN